MCDIEDQIWRFCVVVGLVAAPVFLCLDFPWKVDGLQYPFLALAVFFVYFRHEFVDGQPCSFLVLRPFCQDRDELADGQRYPFLAPKVFY